MKLEYYRTSSDKGDRPTSALAVVSVIIGLFAFPLLFHWTVATRVPPAMAIIWPACCLLFCLLVFFRAMMHRKRFDDVGHALCGVALATIWLIAGICFVM